MTSRSVASYVDRQNFKAITFSSRNFLTKAELLLNLYKIMRKDMCKSLYSMCHAPTYFHISYT